MSLPLHGVILLGPIKEPWTWISDVIGFSFVLGFGVWTFAATILATNKSFGDVLMWSPPK
jgi:hypothetical protein